MKYSSLFIQAIAFFTWFTTQAQIEFEQVLPPPPAPQILPVFEAVFSNSIAFADIDGDSDQDVLITGRNGDFQTIVKLYSNNSNGNYTEVTGTPFEGVSSGSIVFADVDGDSDQDVLIAGLNSSGQRIAKLYTNDGSGDYTEVTGTPFVGVDNGSVAFTDIDGDEDQDVLITGQDSGDQPIAKLYTNDGSGGYTEMTGTPFIGVELSSIAFADIDDDSDQDVLITGQNSGNQSIAKLYTNDGSGGFTEVTGTPFDGVELSSVAFKDINGDNDQDVLITGRNNSNQLIAKLYTNNGSGDFTEITGTPFDGVQSSSIAFADIDGDGDQDVLISGQSAGPRITKLYTNDGNGDYTEMTGTSFDGVSFGSSIAFSDIDGDNDQDVLIIGSNGFNEIIAKLYVNDGNGNYTEVTSSPFNGVSNGSIAFADIDGDGDQDVLITGSETTFQLTTKMYSNNGNGGYTEVTETPLDSVTESSIAFSDIDNDGDQDILITGRKSNGQRIAKLYSNDGSGDFTEVPGTPFDGVRDSSIAFSDIDGDGDQDVLITGRNSSNQNIAKLYSNDGSGNFNEITGTPFEGVLRGSIAFADIDGDGDQDVLITGQNTSNQRIAKLYTNDGSGGYTEMTGFPIDGVDNGSIAFADIDGDGDQDILIDGNFFSDKLYINDGSGSYTGVSGTPFDDLRFSSIAFSDVDSDGDQDVLITGLNNNQKIAKLYANDGSGSYTEVTGTPFDGAENGSIAFSDIDGDGDQDVLITGLNIGGESIAKLYRNMTIVECNLQTSIQTSNVSCPGENDGALDLSITGGTAPYTFLWSNGATTEDIDNLASGTYSVTITDNDGCETFSSATITVEDTEDPVLDCLSDQTVTLTSDQTEYTLPDYVANGDVSATDNCNVSSISQTPVAGTVLTPGVYTISFTATDDSGNTSNCSFTLTVEETLGIRSVDFGKITLYPNPADQLVIINNSQQNELKEMLVYDIQGRRVMQVELNSIASSITLDVSQLASATYTVVLKTENNQVTRRLIKK